MVLVMMMYAILRHNCVMKVDSLEGFGGGELVHIPDSTSLQGPDTKERSPDASLE